MSRRNHEIAWRIHQAGWRMLALALPLLFNPFSRFNFEPDKAALFRALTLVLLGSWLLGGKRPFPARRRYFQDGLLILLAALLTLATLFSIEPSRSFWGEARWGQGWLTWMDYLLLFWLARQSLTRTEEREAVIDALLFASLPVALYGLAQRAGWDPLGLSPPWERIRSTLPHANALGGYLVMALPFALHRWLNGRSRRRWLWAGLGGLLTLTLLLTFSRSSWLAALAGGWGYLILKSRQNRNRRRLIWLLITAVLGLVLLIGLSLLPPASPDDTAVWQALTSLFRASSPTVQIRLLAWRSIISAVGQRPWLGYGPETLDLALPPYLLPKMALYGNLKAIAGRGHNEFLELALFAGIPAAVVYLLLLGVLAGQGWRRLRNGRSLALPLLVAVFAGWSHHMLDVTTITTGAYFWLFLGMLAAEPEAALATERGMWRRPALRRSVVIACLVSILLISARLIWADVVGRKGMALSAIGVVDAAEIALAQAERLDPRRDAYTGLQAELYLTRGTAVALDEAANQLKAALDHTPTDMALWRLLLRVRQAQGEAGDIAWDEAFAVCRAMLNSSPRDPDLYMLCGDLRLAARDPASALPFYQSAARLTPAYAQPFYNLATVYRWLGYADLAGEYTQLANTKRQTWESSLRQR